ncbi:hypothetical protein EDD22DRAFT_968598 [Suillus occidentalis]|nr:hypothetical protein EDD22DRAFT_968598 [Suillus occidentalis]
MTCPLRNRRRFSLRMALSFALHNDFALTKSQGTADQATAQQANTAMTQAVEYDGIVRSSAEKIAAKIAEHSHDDPCIGGRGAVFCSKPEKVDTTFATIVPSHRDEELVARGRSHKSPFIGV